MTATLMVEHTVHAIQYQGHVGSVLIHIADASSGIIGIIDDADAQRTVRNQILYFLSVGKGFLDRRNGLLGALVQFMVG